MRAERALAGLFLALVLGCTNAGLYSAGSNGSGPPDRASFKGQVCVPAATGDSFPVKVLFAVEGGATVTQDLKGTILSALASVTGRFAGAPYIQFEMAGYSAVAQGLQGTFVSPSDPGLQTAILTYAGFQGQGPISMIAPLALARTLISGDILSGCPGAVGRTRYLVVLLAVSSDTSCDNPGFIDLLTNQCKAFITSPQNDPLACSSCALTQAASDVQHLADQYGAGQVTVQPVYILQQQSTAQEVQKASAQLAAIAKAGGTSLIQTSPDKLESALNGLNYASLQRLLILKRFIAFNRNAIARDGKLLVDTDGDGIPDDDEKRLGLDPTNPDTDGDGLSDGVEVRMGLDPKTKNVINGCDFTQDNDGDGLNDCEERVLGTQRCASDTDGDGIPDLVEVLAGTDPLVPEDLQDTDRDGVLNSKEIEAHTDPLSADVAFGVEHAYGYVISDADPTPDGRACYNVQVNNVGLVNTLDRPNKLQDVPAGTNDIYLYFQAGRANDPRGEGISSLFVKRVKLTSSGREPAGVIPIAPENFVTGY